MPKSTASESSAKPADRRQRVQSAEMGMAILKTLARLGGAASLTAIAAAIDESTAKVHRYLASLVQEGMVAQHETTQQYYLGREAIQIGLAALRQCDPIRMGESALVRLRNELDVTCFIAMMGNKGPTVLRIEEPTLPVTVNMRAGSVMPILWSATGQIFLSFSDDPRLRRQAEEEYTEATPERRAQLGGPQPVERLRRQVREQGCAIVEDLMLRGISAIAAPIFDAKGGIAAVLTALGASTGFDERPGGRICPEVMREAAAISYELGYEPAIADSVA